jgi:hypothetical protein
MPIHEPNKCLALEPLSAGAFSKAATDKRNAGLEILTASSLFALKGHLLSFLERPHATPPAPPHTLCNVTSICWLLFPEGKGEGRRDLWQLILLTNSH